MEGRKEDECPGMNIYCPGWGHVQHSILYVYDNTDRSSGFLTFSLICSISLSVVSPKSWENSLTFTSWNFSLSFSFLLWYPSFPKTPCFVLWMFLFYIICSSFMEAICYLSEDINGSFFIVLSLFSLSFPQAAFFVCLFSFGLLLHLRHFLKCLVTLWLAGIFKSEALKIWLGVSRTKMGPVTCEPHCLRRQWASGEPLTSASLSFFSWVNHKLQKRIFQTCLESRRLAIIVLTAEEEEDCRISARSA